jgi:GT2 family glycosyltransferase
MPEPFVENSLVAPRPTVSIAVIPRERNSLALAALDRLLAATPEPFELVYVGSRLTRATWSHIEDRAGRRNLKLVAIRSRRHLSANRARQRALEQASGEYVVMLDNDVFVNPNWLTPLIDCAVANRATAVMPAVLERYGAHKRTHLTGGSLSISPFGTVDSRMRDHRRTVSATLGQRIEPEATELIEFHCLLIHRAQALACDLVDPVAPPALEHIDFCLAAANNDCRMWVEPRSSATVVVPDRATLNDLLRFRWQWSVRRHRLGMSHFCRKWQVQDTYPARLLRHRHRRHLVAPGLTERVIAFARRALPPPAYELARRAYAGARRATSG